MNEPSTVGVPVASKRQLTCSPKVSDSNTVVLAKADHVLSTWQIGTSDFSL